MAWPVAEPHPTKYWLADLRGEPGSLRRLVRLAKGRWRIEQDYRELKDELGLDHFEGRSWTGWYHHVTLVSMAYAFLVLERARAKKNLDADVAPDPASAPAAAPPVGCRYINHTEVVPTTKSYTTCDICGQRIETFRRACFGCGRDACKFCSRVWESDLFTGEGYGDYPNIVCRQCHELALPYEPAARDLRVQYDEAIEELENRWKKECQAKQVVSD